MSEATDEQLVRAFAAAAYFLKDKCEREGWHWTSNFLREYVRAAFAYQFSNTRSPEILRRVASQHADLKEWIEVGTRKVDKQNSGTLFKRDFYTSRGH